MKKILMMVATVATMLLVTGCPKLERNVIDVFYLDSWAISSTIPNYTLFYYDFKVEDVSIMQPEMFKKFRFDVDLTNTSNEEQSEIDFFEIDGNSDGIIEQWARVSCIVPTREVRYNINYDFRVEIY